MRLLLKDTTKPLQIEQLDAEQANTSVFLVPLVGAELGRAANYP